jgi:hypothetical protein
MYQAIQKELVTTLMQADSFQQRIEDEMTAILDK